MKIHEYQGKELLKKFGVWFRAGCSAQSVDDAVKAAESLGGKVWVVKAQIHAGGRGKGGGVKVAKSLDEVRQYAGQILGMQLVTHQTGPEGQKVRRLLIEEGADIKQGILRRRADRPRDAEGGHDGLFRRRHGHRGSRPQDPEKILKVFVDPG
jgi:succinyl-CoA synthetase beta subunit